MILAGLLLSLTAQDLLQDIQSLRAGGEYLEALEAAEALEDPEQARLQRVLTLWTAGDLGGALVEIQARAGDAVDAVQRDLCWHGTILALQLGEAELARELLDGWERQVRQSPDLTPQEITDWIQGWAPGQGVEAARARVDELQGRLDEAGRGTALARGTTVGLGLVVLLALGLLARR